MLLLDPSYTKWQSYRRFIHEITDTGFNPSHYKRENRNSISNKPNKSVFGVAMDVPVVSPLESISRSVTIPQNTTIEKLEVSERL